MVPKHSVNSGFPAWCGGQPRSGPLRARFHLLRPKLSGAHPLLKPRDGELSSCSTALGWRKDAVRPRRRAEPAAGGESAVQTAREEQRGHVGRLAMNDEPATPRVRVAVRRRAAASGCAWAVEGRRAGVAKSAGWRAAWPPQSRRAGPAKAEWSAMPRAWLGARWRAEQPRSRAEPAASAESAVQTALSDEPG